MIRKLLLYCLLVGSAGVMLTPIIWLIAAVFKVPDDLFHYLFFPPISQFSFHNFVQLFDQVPFVRFMINSFFVTGSTVTIQLVFSSLGGFALAKYQFKGKQIVIVIMLLMMMILCIQLTRY